MMSRQSSKYVGISRVRFDEMAAEQAGLKAPRARCLAWSSLESLRTVVNQIDGQVDEVGGFSSLAHHPFGISYSIVSGVSPYR